MPELAVDLSVYVVVVVAMALIGVPGPLSALIGGILFAAVIWRHVQR